MNSWIISTFLVVTLTIVLSIVASGSDAAFRTILITLLLMIYIEIKRAWK